MDGELNTLIKVWLTIFASLLYSYFIASKFPKGSLRLLSLLPIFSLFTLLPLFFSSILLSGITSIFITWLSIFKLLFFSFDSGPLVSHPPFSFFLFALITCFPIRIKPNPPKHSPKPPILPLNLPIKLLLYATFVTFNEYSKLLHPKILLFIYCIMLYLFLDILLGLSNALVRSTLGIELEPPSNEPYLATLLQDFWGRRWNLLVSNTLRCTVYKPARAAAERVVGRRWAAAAAVMAAFVVSGVMHELIYYYVTRARPTWEVTWFFVLHGVCVVVEFEVKRALGHRRMVHPALMTAVTLAFVVVTAAWLFFPPLYRNNTIEGIVGEFTAAAEFVKGWFATKFGYSY